MHEFSCFGILYYSFRMECIFNTFDSTVFYTNFIWLSPLKKLSTIAPYQKGFNKIRQLLYFFLTGGRRKFCKERSCRVK